MLEEEAETEGITSGRLRHAYDIILFVFGHLRTTYIPDEGLEKLEDAARRLYDETFPEHPHNTEVDAACCNFVLWSRTDQDVGLHISGKNNIVNFMENLKPLCKLSICANGEYIVVPVGASCKALQRFRAFTELHCEHGFPHLPRPLVTSDLTGIFPKSFHGWLQSLDEDTAMEVVNAANSLRYTKLVEAASAFIASIIMNKDPEEIRKIFRARSEAIREMDEAIRSRSERSVGGIDSSVARPHQGREHKRPSRQRV